MSYKSPWITNYIYGTPHQLTQIHFALESLCTEVCLVGCHTFCGICACTASPAMSDQRRWLRECLDKNPAEIDFDVAFTGDSFENRFSCHWDAATKQLTWIPEE